MAKVLDPDIVISFGTAGGMINSEKMKIGDVICSHGAVFMDRLRTSSTRAFQWGVWGGLAIKAETLVHDLNLQSGVVGSQLSYTLNEHHIKLIKKLDIRALDMEAAPIAQIFNQTGINFMILKVISNGVYPDNPEKMEQEYLENREEVSTSATKVLSALFEYLQGKTLNRICKVVAESN